MLIRCHKPLRPFTILPATANREQLRQQVFRPDHRLPTMTVEEYLEVERERGNIITGGGWAYPLITYRSSMLTT